MARNKSQANYSYLKDNLSKIIKSDKFIKFSSSLTSVLLGILCGFIALMVINTANSGVALGYIFISGFSSSAYIAEFIYQAAPLVMTGLSFAFAYKAKLINLGVPGQFAMGAFVAIVCAINGLPWYVNIPLAFAAGAVWGILPGLMKVYFNVTEVASTIMFDWIAVTIIYILLNNMPSVLNDSLSSTIDIASINLSGLIPSLGLDQWDSNFSIAIFISIAIAIFVYWFICKTKLGYEIRAYASNSSVSKAVGISSKKIILSTFLIAGGLAGIGGALLYLSPYASSGYELTYTLLPNEGIIGIAVSILAFNNPIACVVAALVFSYIGVSSDNLISLGYSSANVTFIIGFIIYFSSFGILLNKWIRYNYLSRQIKVLSKKISNFREWLFELLKGNAKPKIIPNAYTDSIVEVANSNVVTFHKEEEISTVFIDYSDVKKEKGKERIAIKFSPESEDLEDYNPDHYANIDIPQLKRHSTKKKEGDK